MGSDFESTIRVVQELRNAGDLAGVTIALEHMRANCGGTCSTDFVHPLVTRSEAVLPGIKSYNAEDLRLVSRI